MLDKIDGLPAHVLLIHAVVVLLPLAAIMVAVSAVWPAARRKLGFLTPLVALIALILVPITTHAGEYLESKLPRSPTIERHAHLGDELLPWAIGLFVVAVVVYLLGRRYDMPTPAQAEPASAAATLPVWVTAVVAVVAIGVSTGTSIQLYRIGESGAKAVWGGVLDSPSGGG